MCPENWGQTRIGPIGRIITAASYVQFESDPNFESDPDSESDANFDTALRGSAART